MYCGGVFVGVGICISGSVNRSETKHVTTAIATKILVMIVEVAPPCRRCHCCPDCTWMKSDFDCAVGVDHNGMMGLCSLTQHDSLSHLSIVGTS